MALTQASGIRNYSAWFFNNCDTASRPQPMNNAMGTGRAINVSPDQATVCCRGASNALGHPAVYLTFAEQMTVQCYYCGCEYTQAPMDGDHPQEAD